MEKLSILAAISALPAVIFMLIAKMNGGNKAIGWIGLKLPSLVSLIALVIMAMVYFQFIKLAQYDVSNRNYFRNRNDSKHP